MVKNKLILLLILISVLCFLCTACYLLGLLVSDGNVDQEKQIEKKAENINDKVTEESTEPKYEVIEVTDGDTIKVSLNEIVTSIRLIGIDSPEMNKDLNNLDCYTVEATNKAKEILTGKKVTLESDPSQDDKDKYNRLLRFVFLEDGTDFNKYMISNGYAKEYTYDKPYKYQKEYKEAQEKAKTESLGLWGDACKCVKSSKKECISCKKAKEVTVAWDCTETSKEIEDQTCTSSCTVLKPAVIPKTTPAPVPKATTWTCDCSKTCDEISSCTEAYYLLNTCGCKKRDADNDGIPCESAPLSCG